MKTPPTISASIVTFNSDLAQLQATIESVIAEFSQLEKSLGSDAPHLILIDNDSSEGYKKELSQLVESFKSCTACNTKVQLVFNKENKGFGYGHNVATRLSNADYHLITNPDIILHTGSLANAVREISLDHDLALVLPIIYDEYQRPQYLHCKIPTLADILLRSIAPALLKKAFSARLEKARDIPINRKISSKEQVVFSGCLMLVNREEFLSVDGFDENYFLYFEDYDISLRLTKNKSAKICSGFQVKHFGGNTHKKNFQHKVAFFKSYLRFSRTH